jgi:putative ABC transport system ATP-binding protein
MPNELSGGQKQRVAIARSLIANPKVILADEPTGALDSTTSYEVMEILKNINQEGITVIIVTHEDDISRMTKRVIKLRDGTIEADFVPEPLEIHALQP